MGAVETDAAEKFKEVMKEVAKFEGDERLEGVEALEQLENNFRYHSPTPEKQVKFEKLRATAKGLAYLMMEMCPECPERVDAIKHLELASMLINAGISRNP